MARSTRPSTHAGKPVTTPTPAASSIPATDERDADLLDSEDGDEQEPQEVPDDDEIQAIIQESELLVANAVADGSSAFGRYLHELQRYPVLSTVQEARLAALARQGSPDARDALVRHNLRFVITIARRYSGHGVELDDLVQEGNTGILRAASKFNERRGVRFVSYAVWWITQSIRAALAAHQRSIRIPVNRATQLARVHRAQGELTRRLGRTPLPDEVARVAGIPLEMVNTLLHVSQSELSLESPHPAEPDSGPLGDRLGVDETISKRVATRALGEAIDGSLKTLRSRDEQVLRFCYGFDGGREYTLEEIGAVFGITRERVRQIRDRALNALRNPDSEEAIKLRELWEDGLVDSD